MNTIIKSRFSPDVISLPIIHIAEGLYQKIYVKSKQINKFDRFAAYLKLNNCCLDCLSLTITAALESSPEKIKTLSQLRINVELLKHLLRLNYNCQIITQNTYQVWIEQAQEISKETNLWLKNQQSKKSGSSNITPDSSQH